MFHVVSGNYFPSSKRSAECLLFPFHIGPGILFRYLPYVPTHNLTPFSGIMEYIFSHAGV